MSPNRQSNGVTNDAPTPHDTADDFVLATRINAHEASIVDALEKGLAESFILEFPECPPTVKSSYIWGAGVGSFSLCVSPLILLVAKTLTSRGYIAAYDTS